MPVASAVGRVLAEDVAAQRALPQYDHATTDGYAVRATDAASADGWVVVPESRDGLSTGETVTVEDWEFQP